MTPVEFVERLRTDNEEFYRDDRGRGALKDLQVVFPLPWIYLAELVQNAIDTKATRLRFATGPEEGLRFEHNGNRFTPADVRALCTRGVSTKSTNTVGFMGVGFKSVFKAYEKVVVSSGEWKFQLSVPSDEMFGVRQWIGAVLPTWVADAGPPSEGFTCRFDMSHRVSDGTSCDDLTQLLREGQALLPLLAWNQVSEIEVEGQAWRLCTREVPIKDGDASRVHVEAEARDESRRSWLLFVKSYQPSEMAVLRFLQHRQIQPAQEERESVLLKARRARNVILFCELSSDGSPLTVNRGQCFSLVPTGQTTCLGLHMQAEWLLDISRREPMRISGDPWQQEILAQVPCLLKAYLDWLTSDETDEAQSWSAGYGALPGSSENTEIDSALRAGEVAEELRSLLRDCRFVPCELPDNTIDFAKPTEARRLPTALQRCTEGENGPSASLFGPRIVAPGTLGPRATTFLDDMGLLPRLTPGELQAEWAPGKVGQWYASSGQAAGAAYTRLVGALGDLDADAAWATTGLRCLPVADGDWRTRNEVRRYPPNWGILSPVPNVSGALEPFAGTGDQLLDWKTDQVLRRDPAASRYLEPLESPSLESVASRWWASIPVALTPSERDLVVEFTDLVRRQKTLTRMIPKVLAIANECEQLLPIDGTLLADPYSGSYRRALFPDVPVVSATYLTAISDATDAEWRAFFESQSPSPRGRPVVLLVKTTAGRDDLASAGQLPSLRVTYGVAPWGGLQIDSNTFYTVDTRWPELVENVISQPSQAGAYALQQWMVEQPAYFEKWCHPSIVYIRYGSGSTSSCTLPRGALWLTALRDRPWLFDQTGKGPYLPRNILVAADVCRPDAPVAHLVERFATLAAQLGIEFGKGIPSAPAIDRLRGLGPTASWAALSGLTRDAIREARDDRTRTDLLRSVLNDAPLFALPGEHQTPDGCRRVGARRLVRKSRRSTLGDWVCPCDDYPEAGPEQAVLQEVLSVVTVPEATTPDQAADFLSWVWAHEPDADTVRLVLPRAYQYARESETLRASLRGQAKVFVTARRWVRVTEDVFLNDLGIAERDLLAADAHVLLATPGHLGEDDENRRQTCALIGLQLASHRYRLEVQKFIDGVTTPETWRLGFALAQDRFWEQFIGADDGDGHKDRPPALELTSVGTIKRRLLKDDEEIDVVDSPVAITAVQAYVVGEPLDFAPDLAQALIEHWGIALRRDGYALGSRLTGLLARIDRMPEAPEGPEPPKPPEADSEEVTEPPETAPTDTTVPKDGPPANPEAQAGQKQPAAKHASPSHTHKQKDAQHNWLQEKRKELRQQLRNVERQIAEGLSAEAEPEEEDDKEDDRPKRTFADDERYRQAVLDYEKARGRFPEAAAKGQAGFDVDSYSHPLGHPDRTLVRRIEVKGKGTLWTGDEIVELSDRQMKDALAQRVDEGERKAATFDYWLYVVETCGGELQVIPLRNPVRAAARFAFRGGLWRSEEEAEDPVREATASGYLSEVEMT